MIAAETLEMLHQQPKRPDFELVLDDGDGAPRKVTRLRRVGVRGCLWRCYASAQRVGTIEASGVALLRSGLWRLVDPEDLPWVLMDAGQAVGRPEPTPAAAASSWSGMSFEEIFAELERLLAARTRGWGKSTLIESLFGAPCRVGLSVDIPNEVLLGAGPSGFGGPSLGELDLYRMAVARAQGRR